jgi:endonuclease/exonuclease/phosphatase family metal-dependent hydrolase
MFIMGFFRSIGRLLRWAGLGIVVLSLNVGSATGLKPPIDSNALLSFKDLRSLYGTLNLEPPLEQKLNRLLTVPFVDNTNTGSIAAGTSQMLGDYLRVAHWNIEQGIEFDALVAALHSEERMLPYLDTRRFPIGTEKRNEIIEQAEALRNADVLVLNEVDWGMKRTGYRNVAQELAKHLRMNYAFGVEFIELSPVQLSETASEETSADGLVELFELDPERYKGLHGTAILSRYPLENVRLIPFRYQAYDWFEAEKKGVSFVEKARRKLVEAVFLEKAMREVRRGGRMMMLADIRDPRIPEGVATIVATHLEIRTTPANRRRQFAELLETIKPIRNPVVIAGDMNTSTNDMTPTSVQREVRKKFGKVESLAKTGINYLLGLGMFEGLAGAALTFGRNHGDPTVRHIPVFMPNHERKFFSALKEFRFADGGAFDFRGESARAAGGRRNTLANSNERDEKGFVTTFRTERPVKFIGRYKLDWIFVKPARLTDPSDYQQSYAFAPHFGRTLGAVNSVAVDRISDHSPMIVDLPFSEPQIPKLKTKKQR